MQRKPICKTDDDNKVFVSLPSVVPNARNSPTQRRNFNVGHHKVMLAVS
jgi:hypothetical protein